MSRGCAVPGPTASLLMFVVSLLVTAAVFPGVLRFARGHGLMDNPGARKLQRRPVPVLGGTAVLFGVVVSMGVGLSAFGLSRGTCAVPCGSEDARGGDWAVEADAAVRGRAAQFQAGRKIIPDEKCRAWIVSIHKNTLSTLSAHLRFLSQTLKHLKLCFLTSAFAPFGPR